MLIFWVTCVHMNLLHPKVNIHLNKGSLQAAQGCLGCLALRTESCLRVKICQCCVVLRSQGRVAGWGRWSSGDVGRVPLASLSPGHCCTAAHLPGQQQEGEVGSRHRARPLAASLFLIMQLGNLLNLNTPEQQGKVVPEGHFLLLL